MAEQDHPGTVHARAPEHGGLDGGRLDPHAVHRVAWHLRARGADRGTLIGVCIGREPRLLLAIYAVLRVGSAYVPLDPGLPPDRLAHLPRGSAAPMLITDDRHPDRLDRFSGVVVSLDEEAVAIADLLTLDVVDKLRHLVVVRGHGLGVAVQLV